jgi:hypothetical protein
MMLDGTLAAFVFFCNLDRKILSRKLNRRIPTLRLPNHKENQEKMDVYWGREMVEYFMKILVVS